MILMLPLLIFAGSVDTARMDTVVVRHKYYTTFFDTVKHYPVMVQWWLSNDMLACQDRLKRIHKFAKDPQLGRYTDLAKDYRRKGYDRGHNMPAVNCKCNTAAMKECFYYSNMTPQTPSLNRGRWESLEDHTIDLVLQNDSVKVWCGSIGEVKKIGCVSVPAQCWKVLYIKRLQRYEAYLFNNDTIKSMDLQSHRVTLDSICKLTRLILK